MQTRVLVRIALFAGLCLHLPGAFAQTGAVKKAAGPADSFLQDHQDMMRGLTALQYSDVAATVGTAKCGPAPPEPLRCRPPLCPPPASVAGLRNYTEGRTKTVAAAFKLDEPFAPSSICDPRPVVDRLNQFVAQLDRLGGWIIKADSKGVTIRSTVPPGIPSHPTPELKANAARTRAFTAIDYLNDKAAKGEVPNIIVQ